MYLLIFVGIVGFSAAIGTTLATQINNFIDEAPRYVEDAESWLRDNVDEDIEPSRRSPKSRRRWRRRHLHQISPTASLTMS